YNIRDLGGWTGMDGYKVKYDVLYRGSRLRQNKSLDGSGKTFTESVRQLKNDYKFNAEIDFRTADDVTATTSVFGNKVQAKYLKVPTANECLGENILSGDAYITAMNSIIAWARLNKKIYLASSLGAERVGTMAFLINGLLGVSESDLAKDYELSSFTEDSLARGKEFKRTNADYVAMVNKIKTLEGSTLQVKIFNYFLNGVNGTAVAEEDLKWFICYMLDYPWSDFQQTELSVKERKRPIKPRIYSTAGYEVDEATEGLYIIDGNTYLINH
ncbi:MAG: tyrosine-protein phosphatase, partial [Bacteroidaceae bacterium]|nr:tyrosine-protein phosphatase [Bacteroidaceae bacterium]